MEQAALRDVTLCLSKGDFVSVMGPSGCGKSTLLNLVGGLDKPTRGRILFDGRNMASMSDDELTMLRRDRIGLVFQFFNLLPHLTALENTALPLYMLGVSTREANRRAREILDYVGLSRWESHVPSRLSGGQQQRVAIARGLVREPEVLLADEPTGNLDSHNTSEVMSLFERLSSDIRLTIILVTHQADVAAGADKIIHMNDGSIPESSTPCPSNDA